MLLNFEERYCSTVPDVLLCCHFLCLQWTGSSSDVCIKCFMHTMIYSPGPFPLHFANTVAAFQHLSVFTVIFFFFSQIENAYRKRVEHTYSWTEYAQVEHLLQL